ncbi:cyclic GMP-AMP synthase [Plectropomus leopardus]|uniref:cyclic GMP-AMP synthase n=1 Tax=Plectropomus leopardus TaxID=160734 RepID=UPI001C4B82C1|nr:cyclic GMP-AMP synthase [Plectropomus leopardus]
MTGRGRPRKAASPDTKGAKCKTKLAEMNQATLPGCQGKEVKKGEQNGTTKEQKPGAQKKKSHTEEKLSIQKIQKDKPTEEIKQQRTPTEATKAPMQGRKAKTCADKAKTTNQTAEEITKTKPKTPKDTTKDSPKALKAAKCGGKAKSPEQLSEETTKVQPDAPKDTTKVSIKTTMAKTCAGKAKATEKIPGETTRTQPRALKDTKKADRHEDKAAVDLILHTTLEDLKIKRIDRSDASQVINEIVKNIIRHLKEKTQCFKEVNEPLNTGSYYENLKISNPDEFDVMLAMPVDRVNINPFRQDGAFYSVQLKRGKNPLKVFEENDILSASEMLKEFRKEVKTCVKQFKDWEVTKKKKGCPAVTLTTKVKSITISLDVVLSIVVKSSWPPFTKDGIKIDHWLGAKVKQEYKRMPYYLVPKYEGSGTVEDDGVLAKDVWRISFSHVEKAILKNHGSEKTCCEKAGERCCRKECLKLLKHLLSLLKEKDSSFDKFCSYHAKTTLLHACCSRTKDSDWKTSDLRHCFELLLKDFEAHLEKGALHNFFIPTQNLLSNLNQNKCRSLAHCLKEQRENGFPIFQ